MKAFSLLVSMMMSLSLLAPPSSFAVSPLSSGSSVSPSPSQTFQPQGSPLIPGQTAFPDLLQVTPATLTQGQNLTLFITGQHLHQDMRLKLGAGVSLGSPVLINERTASVAVSVAADAAPGSRVVQVQFHDRLQASRVRVNLVPANVRPLVRTIMPNTLNQGQSYNLTLTGMDLQEVTAVDFGPGIAVDPPVATSTSLRVKLTVAASASPGLRKVLLKGSGGSYPASVPVTVMAATAPGAAATAASPGQSLPVSLDRPDHSLQKAPPDVAPAVTVQTVLPNQWAQGKSYQVTVAGSRFNEGLEADFGAGVEVRTLAVASPARLTMTVKVSGSAAPGLRTLKLRTGSSEPWSTFSAGAWVVAAPQWARSKPTPELVAPDLNLSYKGRIELLTPGDYLNANQMYPEILNEQTRFTWREQNPGLAQWYEFRLVTEEGYIIEKQRIDPVKLQFNGQQIDFLPGLLKMDTAYLLDLLTNDRKRGEHMVVHGLAGQICWWEVAGYRTYTTVKTVAVAGASQSGPAKTEKVVESRDVEVEISDRWSLRTPDKPSGLGCTGKAASASAITIANIDKGNRAANYAEDRWELTGKLNISTVPYAIHIGAMAKGPGNIVTYLPNLFLDWGDGSGVVPLEIDMSKPSGPELLPLGRAYHHQYQRSGSYTVRIFLLPEADIQQGPPDALASVYDAVSGSTQASAGDVQLADGDYNPYYRVLKGIQASAGTGFQVSGSGGQAYQFQESPLYAQAGRAHLIYCETKEISAREDLVAQGPLHLEALAITGYNGQGAGGESRLRSGKGQTGRQGDSKQRSPADSNSSEAKNAAPQETLALSTNSVPGLQATAQSSLQTMLGMATDAEISACGLLQGNAVLDYYGEGRARVTWSLIQGGSRMVISSVEEAFASPPRTAGGMILTEATQNVATPESFASAALSSPVTEMSEAMIGQNYSLVVEAEVLAQTSQMDQAQLLDLIGSAPKTVRLSGSTGYAENLLSWLITDANAASLALGGNPHVKAFEQSGVKLSVLAPSREGSSGRPVTASLNVFAKARMTEGLIVQKEKPYYLKSDPFRYRVKPSDPGQPCRLLFPTSSGDNFSITNLQVNDSKGKLQGSGVLDMNLYTGAAGEPARYLLPVAIDGWQVAADGMKVTAGSLDLPLDYSINQAGMRIQLKRLAAQARQTPMNLTLSAKPADPDLHLAGSTQPPEWLVTGPLSEDGDWYAQEAGGADVKIGNSGFSIRPQTMVLDLSAVDGLAANPGGAGKEWAGLHFGEEAALIPNLFEFQVPEANKGRVSNWGVEGTRLIGKAELAAPFSTAYKGGTISFASISVDTSKNSLAIYRDMDVYVPWLETHLKGDVSLISGVPGKEAYFDFSTVTRDEVVKQYRGITMSVKNLLFGNFPQTGWGAWSESTTFRFEAEKVLFADNVIVPGIIYSMDGKPFLEDGNSVEIPLGGKSTLGQTPIDLVSVRVQCLTGESSVFAFDFATTFSISEVLSSVAVPVHYGLSRTGKVYTAGGPDVPAFDLEVVFPAGQPRIESKVHIEYTGEGLSTSAMTESPGSWWPFSVAQAYADSGAKDSFAGTLDMKMFGGPPIQAEFRLGYLGGRDYWLMRAALDLGAGVPFAPPFLKLYKIRGGLGHNFPLDAFKSTYPITVVEPVIDDSYLFMAGMQVGSSDGFICTMDGDLTIKPGDGARLDFKAWLLDSQHAGNGNFQGYLQYAAGGFDGMLSGHFSLLEDAVYFDIPQNACTMHFGGGQPWHIYAGQKNGLKLRMHLLIRDVDGYMMLDEDALQIGGGVYYYLGASIGHISGEIQTGLAVTSQPHISGYGKGGVHAEVCAYDVCVGTGISVRVDAGALPVKASAHGCVEIPIPLWNPDVCATFSL